MISLFLAILSSCNAPQPEITTERGVSLGLFASDPNWDYRGLVDEVADHGASDILFVMPLKQRDVHANDIRFGVEPKHLEKSIAHAKSRGLRVSLMPIIQLDEVRTSAEWRGLLEPTSPSDWWDSYCLRTLELADLANKYSIQRFFVGSELVSSVRNTTKWQALVSKVRATYSGKLSYSSNWDNYKNISFWSTLDEVSITSYFPVDKHPDLKWRRHLDEMQTFARGLHKPLVLSEVGYPAIESAAREPWNGASGAKPDEALQFELLKTALEEIRCAEPSSIFVWNWFGKGGRETFDYSPRGRMAARLIKSEFSSWTKYECH